MLCIISLLKMNIKWNLNLIVLMYLKNSYFCTPRSIFTTGINYPSPLGSALERPAKKLQESS